MATCETHGHLWGHDGKCVMCKEPKVLAGRLGHASWCAHIKSNKSCDCGSAIATASPPTDAVALTIRDISELDYDTPVGQAHILMVTAEELRIILERRFPAEPALPQTDDIRVVCDDLREHGFPAYATLIGSLQAHIIALEFRLAPEPSALQLLAQDIYGRYLRGSVEPAELLQQLVNAICDGLPDADEAVTCPTCHGKGATAQNGVQYCNCPALTKAGSES